METVHQPVMLKEVLTALEVRPNGTYVDCTVGGGGHTLALLESVGLEGRVIGLDQDPAALERVAGLLSVRWPNLVLVRSNFSEADRVLSDLGIEQVDGMMVDLGISSDQLELSGRGFSFERAEPLDMRMDPGSDLRASDLIERLPERELADLIYKYGEERASRRLARAIVRARQANRIETSRDLAELIRKSLSRPGRPPRIHPATRTFQALRLAVNRELEHLAEFLTKAPGLLRTGGRVVMISFHSLEDRLVKQAMIRRVREEDLGGPPVLKALYKKPLRPTEEETGTNPRSRSAKLRAGERIG